MLVYRGGEVERGVGGCFAKHTWWRAKCRSRSLPSHSSSTVAKVQLSSSKMSNRPTTLGCLHATVHTCNVWSVDVCQYVRNRRDRSEPRKDAGKGRHIKARGEKGGGMEAKQTNQFREGSRAVWVDSFEACLARSQIRHISRPPCMVSHDQIISHTWLGWCFCR